MVTAMDVNLSTIRQRLNRLIWKDGLTREEIRRQWRNIPISLYERLPLGYRFRGPGDVMSYLERLLRDQPIIMGPVDAPHGYEVSSAARSLDILPAQHGVGSGSDSGVTGGGSAQTGTGREGVTYGGGQEEDHGHTA